MGHLEQAIARTSLQMGKGLPDRIENAPVLTKGLDLYLQAFFDLDSERSHGIGLTRIPWSSIKIYAEFYEFDFEQTEALFFHICKMDNANLKRLDKKGK